MLISLSSIYYIIFTSFSNRIIKKAWNQPVCISGFHTYPSSKLFHAAQMRRLLTYS